VKGVKQKSIDRTGQRFGRYVVIARRGSDRTGCALWLARCDCGTEQVIGRSIFKKKNGGKMGCDRCYQHAPNFGDLTGQRFGRLIAVSSFTRNHDCYWLCHCDCGNTVNVRDDHLKNGGTRSCKCLMREIVGAGTQRTHGKSKTPLFQTWCNIKSRCYNPKCAEYRVYGKLGVTLYKPWLDDFEAFEIGVGPRPSPQHSLDRFPDPAGNYEPGNVRWATKKEQARNKRNNVVLELNGVRKCLSEWAEVTGLKFAAIRSRLGRGWSVERTLTTPVL